MADAYFFANNGYGDDFNAALALSFRQGQEGRFLPFLVQAQMGALLTKNCCDTRQPDVYGRLSLNSCR